MPREDDLNAFHEAVEALPTSGLMRLFREDVNRTRLSTSEDANSWWQDWKVRTRAQWAVWANPSTDISKHVGFIYIVWTRTNSTEARPTPLYIGLAKFKGKSRTVSSLYKFPEPPRWAINTGASHLNKLNACIEGYETTYVEWIERLFRPGTLEEIDPVFFSLHPIEDEHGCYLNKVESDLIYLAVKAGYRLLNAVH